MRKTAHGDYEKIISFPVFSGYDVRIIFAEDTTKACASRPRTRDKQHVAEGASAFHISHNKGTSWLFFRIGNCPSGDVAHECWHAVRCMFNWINADLENELVAYHLGHLVQAVMNFRNRLIDFKVGVKSKRSKRKNEKQRSTVGRSRS